MVFVQVTFSRLSPIILISLVRVLLIVVVGFGQRYGGSRYLLIVRHDSLSSSMVLNKWRTPALNIADVIHISIFIIMMYSAVFHRDSALLDQTSRNSTLFGYRHSFKLLLNLIYNSFVMSSLFSEGLYFIFKLLQKFNQLSVFI